MAIQKIYLHPNDLQEFKTHCPFSFTKQARSNTPTQSEIVIGGVYQWGDTFYPSYFTFGYGDGQNDFLQKVDEDIPRICCYLANVDTEVVDGITKPYIQYDDETQIAIGRFGITIQSTEQLNSSNLVQIPVVEPNDYKVFSWYEEQDNLASAIWTSPHHVDPALGAINPIYTINYDCNNKELSSLVIDASIPIFVDEASARDYITTGNVQAGKCFNLDEMMLSEPNNVMISSQTYEYDADKIFLSKDSDVHTLYIRTFEGQNISAYIQEGEYYNVHLNISQGSSDIDTIQYRIGSGTFETITIVDFMNSQYSHWNTYRDFRKYGINGFVKGNMWRSTINVMKNKADSDLWNAGQKDKVVPLNFDSEGNPVSMSDTANACNTENDLDDTYKDGASGLITLYQLSKANLETLGDALFDTSASLGDLIKDALSIYGDSPIDAVVSVYHNPIDISAMCQLSSDSLVRLGLYNLTCEGAQTVLRYGKLVTIGSAVINPFYNDFRDFTNFEFELHLPFSSPIPLNAREIMNKTLTIKATCDPYAMQMRYYICIDGIVQKTVDCSFGHQIAIMGNDFAGKAKEVRQELINLAGSGIQLATGTLTSKVIGNKTEGYSEITDVNVSNIASVATSVVSGLNQTMTEPRKTTVGSFASGCAESDVLYPYLSITETVSIKPDNLENTYGLPTNYIGKLGNMHGYTCAELVRLKSDCSEEEKQAIQSALAGGIIL